MPLYNSTGIPTSVLPGDVFFFFGTVSTKEAISNGVASRQFALAYAPGPSGNPTSIGVDFHFASSPTNPDVQIQVSNIDADASYITIYDSLTDPNAGQNWHVDVPLGSFRFVRAKLVSAGGGGNIQAVATR